MSVPVKSGAGLPISTAKADAANASVANNAKSFFHNLIQFR